VTTCFFYPRFW